MKVKIDTKEKMHVITVVEEKLPANMTEEIKKQLLKFLSEPIKNVVVNLKEVKEIELPAAEALISVQLTFSEANQSFVLCNLQPPVSNFLDKNELLGIMNITPTESEAWDIVQMEEIEREFL